MPNDAEELVKGPSISSSNLLEITFIVLRLVLLRSIEPIAMWWRFGFVLDVSLLYWYVIAE